MACIAGCNHDKAQEHADELQHAIPDFQSTLFSEHVEFFIEHEPLEVGTESEFLIHLTELSTYKPYLSGSVTILIDGVSVTSGQPVRPGIFKVSFIPGKAGEFTAEYTFRTGGYKESVTGHVHIFQDHEEPHDEAESGIEGDIAFLKEQAWRNNFMVTETEAGQFASVITTSGEIMAVPGEKKNVTAHHQGIVHFTNRKLVQGFRVDKGQPLFTISTEKMVDNNVKLQYQELQNQFEKSRSEYERHVKLYAQGVISERQLITSRSGYTEDSLRYYSLASNASEEGFRVYATVSGTIHELNVSEGAYVTTGQLLVTISSNQTLLIRADLSQQFYDRLSQIETASFRPAYSDRVYTIEEMNGKLLASGATVAENDHYLPVIFELDNDGRLLEGAFTEVFLKTKQKKEVLTVPLSAIAEEQGGHYVYVQITGESFEKRAVSTGSNDGRNTEILAGLQPGERVVTEGVMLVKAASMVTGTAGHEHAH